jgi:hypothetical protein
VTLTADGGSIADLGDLAAATVSVKLAGGATATASATGQVSGTASVVPTLRFAGILCSTCNRRVARR